jgi:hypothetical protein
MRRARHELAIFDSRHGRRLKRRRNWGQIISRTLTGAVVLTALVGGWILLQNALAGEEIHLRVIGADQQPIAGATIVADNGREAVTSEGGLAVLAFDPPSTLIVTAPGYQDATYPVDVIPPQGSISLQMYPHILQGRVTDADGIGLPGAMVTLGDRTVQSGDFGAFEFVAAEPGLVVAEKAAWVPREVAWGGEETRVDLVLEPLMVKGLRVFYDVAGDDAQFAEILRIADTTAVNALVFDTKEEKGRVLYDSQVPFARESGAIDIKYDVEEVLRLAREHGLYTITRIVAFQDPFASVYNEDAAVKDSENGGNWTNVQGLGWMDATNRDSWQYPIDLAIEACRLGFDEIQFDYVRFPTDGDVSTTVYSLGDDLDADTRVETIAAFLTEAREQIHEEGCAVSADLFAIVLSVYDDQGLGQRVEELSWTVDAISPMIYPSHYGRGWLDLDNPNDYPAEVVGQALEAGMPRLEGGALMRPWLQAFSWTADQMLESIATAEESTNGWMLWNSTSEFNPEGIPSE